MAQLYTYYKSAVWDLGNEKKISFSYITFVRKLFCTRNALFMFYVMCHYI